MPLRRYAIFSVTPRHDLFHIELRHVLLSPRYAMFVFLRRCQSPLYAMIYMRLRSNIYAACLLMRSLQHTSLAATGFEDAAA